MTPDYRYIKLLLILLLSVGLAGCGQGIAGTVDVSPIDETLVVQELQYSDGLQQGPRYAVSMTVPDDWVGQFETRTENNRITFDYIVDDSRAPIFSVEALSTEQYWNQIGGYPGDYRNLLFTADTYFVYYMPIFAYYSGLSDEAYQAFVELAPSVAQTLSAQRVD